MEIVLSPTLQYHMSVSLRVTVNTHQLQLQACLQKLTGTSTCENCTLNTPITAGIPIKVMVLPSIARRLKNMDSAGTTAKASISSATNSRKNFKTGVYKIIPFLFVREQLRYKPALVALRQP